EHRFTVSRGDRIPQSAIKICINKNKTKEYLLNAKVPTPIGKAFVNPNIEDINEYAQDIGFPVVIKPIDGTGGHGVIANIRDKNELKESRYYLIRDLNINSVRLGKHITGIYGRYKVIDGWVVGAFK